MFKLSRIFAAAFMVVAGGLALGQTEDVSIDLLGDTVTYKSKGATVEARYTVMTNYTVTGADAAVIKKLKTTANIHVYVSADQNFSMDDRPVFMKKVIVKGGKSKAAKVKVTLTAEDAGKYMFIECTSADDYIAGNETDDIYISPRLFP